jgi:hypothetical protein
VGARWIVDRVRTANRDAVSFWRWRVLIVLAALLFVGLMLTRVFVALAAGRVEDEGKEITCPGNLFLVIVPIVLLAHLFGKI